LDGLDIEQTKHMLRTRWPDICQALLQGRYRPSPVRKVIIKVTVEGGYFKNK